MENIRNLKGSGASSYSHGIQTGHNAPLLRQRPRDVVAVEVPESSDAHNHGANHESHCSHPAYRDRLVVMGTSSHSHLAQFSYCAPLLRQSPRDGVVIEAPKSKDAPSNGANQEYH